MSAAIIPCCDACGVVTLDLFDVELENGNTETLCVGCCPRDPECSCGGTGSDHDVDCVRFPF